jgi:hypothetical protein
MTPTGGGFRETRPLNAERSRIELSFPGAFRDSTGTDD